MSNPYLAEIRMFGFNFPPKGWAMCNGQILAIAQNQALFALLGTTYGGNGVQTFGLPNLQGRVPLHWGTSSSGTYALGQNAGTESVTLNINQVPTHLHNVVGNSGTATANGPLGNVLAASTQNPYVNSPPAASKVALNPGTLIPYGGSQPHENRQPFNVVNFCIALQGVFPSRN